MKKIVFLIIMVMYSISVVQAQKKNETKKNKENLLVKLQEGEKPVIYVDGKIFDFPMELIDQSKVASILIVKKQKALKKYNAPNGAIIIQTKKGKGIEDYLINGKKNQTIGSENGPKVIIDGKVTDKKTLDKLSPNIIDKMEIIKGERALKKYNAPNGVIIITTKINK